MLETSNKQHFPLLPFNHTIPYLLLKQASFDANLSDDLSSKASYENSEASECEIKCENYFPNQNLILSKPIQSKIDSKCLQHISKKKSPVKMSEDATNFKLTFYQVFTSRKKFQKKFVVMIHNEICSNLDLRRVNREESRSINLYFSHFLRHKDKILLYINKNLNNIRRRIPELNEIPK